MCRHQCVLVCQGPGKRGHFVADTLLPIQMFPRLPARTTFVADTNFVPGTHKMFLILFRNILCPKQMFPSLRSPRNILGNNVSSFTRAFKCPKNTTIYPAGARTQSNGFKDLCTRLLPCSVGQMTKLYANLEKTAF